MNRCNHPTFVALALFIAAFNLSNAVHAGTAFAYTITATFNPDQPDDEVAIECLSRDDILNRGCARFSALDKKCVGQANPYAAIKGSCYFTDKAELVPEIIDTKQKTFSAKWFDQYTVDQIATSLMYRLYLLRDLPHLTAGKKSIDHVPYPFYHRLALQIAFNDRNLDNIVKRGFINQHISRTSNGTFDTHLRLKAETKMVGMILNGAYNDERIKQLLPKYLFTPPSQDIDGLRPHSYSSSYGNIIAVLNDEVLNRMSFSNGDSLSKPTHCRTIKTNLLNKFSRGSNYFEGQIWGTLGLKHIQYFLFNCYLNDSTISPEYITRKTGLPVYACLQTVVNGGSYFKRGKILSGSPDLKPSRPIQ